MFILLPFVVDWPLYEDYPREPPPQLVVTCVRFVALRAPKHTQTTIYPRRKSLFPSHTTGSYFLSTARSFSGISALSVILMCSGHTSVQHLVMLQNPRPFSSCACSGRRWSVSSGCMSSSVWRI